MKKLAIFRNISHQFKTDNFFLIYHGLLRSEEFEIYVGLKDTLEILDGQVYGLGCSANSTTPKETFYHSDNYEAINFSEMDFIWLSGSGSQDAYLDKMQILWVLEQQVKFINSVRGMFFLGNKHWLSGLFPNHHPETYISKDIQVLLNTYQKAKNETWVVKPTVGSLGKDIFRILPSENGAVVIQSLKEKYQKDYIILQKYVEEIAKGEKRVLVCGDEIICYYHRQHPSTSEFRTNLYQGAKASVCTLTLEEEQLCKRVGRFLARHGIYFAGLDMAYPYIFEANIISPGGLSTVFDLTGIDYSDDLIQAIFSSIQSQ